MVHFDTNHFFLSNNMVSILGYHVLHKQWNIGPRVWMTVMNAVDLDFARYLTVFHTSIYCLVIYTANDSYLFSFK